MSKRLHRYRVVVSVEVESLHEGLAVIDAESKLELGKFKIERVEEIDANTVQTSTD